MAEPMNIHEMLAAMTAKIEKADAGGYHGVVISTALLRAARDRLQSDQREADALRKERREARMVVASAWITLGVLARWPRKSRWEMGTRRDYARYFAGRLLEQLNGWGMPPAHVSDADEGKPPTP